MRENPAVHWSGWSIDRFEPVTRRGSGVRLTGSSRRDCRCRAIDARETAAPWPGFLAGGLRERRIAGPAQPEQRRPIADGKGCIVGRTGGGGRKQQGGQSQRREAV